MTGTQVILLGGGGHAQSLLAVLPEAGGRVIGYVDQAPTGLDVPYLGTDAAVLASGLAATAGCCVAVGLDVPLRRTLHERFRAAGFSFPAFAHPRAFVAATARLAAGTVLYPGVFLGTGVVLEENVHVCAGSVIEHGARLGAHTYVAPMAAVAGNVRLGPACLVGINATIRDGLTVAEATTVGAAALLVHSVSEPGGVYVGVPARRREAQGRLGGPGETHAR